MSRLCYMGMKRYTNFLQGISCCSFLATSAIIFLLKIRVVTTTISFFWRIHEDLIFLINWVKTKNFSLSVENFKQISKEQISQDILNIYDLIKLPMKINNICQWWNIIKNLSSLIGEWKNKWIKSPQHSLLSTCSPLSFSPNFVGCYSK